MDAKISGSGVRVSVHQSKVRQRPNTSFQAMVKEGARQTADAVARGAQLAAPALPGGAVVSAAIGQARQGLQAQGSGQQALGGNAVGLAGGGAPVGAQGFSGGGSLDALAASGDKDAILMQETQNIQELNRSFSLQYLQLQQKMQQENREYSMLSNVMKTKHDTAKAAINNIR